MFYFGNMGSFAASILCFLFLLLQDAGAQSTHLQELKSNIAGLYSRFTGNITIIANSGQISSGKVYYQHPNKLRVKLSNGRLIITNGKFLWMCEPSRSVCFKQDVGGLGGGVMTLLKNYASQKQGDRYVFTAPNSEKIKKVIISAQDSMLKSVELSTAEGSIAVNFSNLTIGIGLKSSLFYYKDSNTQIIENPLNN